MIRRISFEQAVYGSFPFWDRGYAVLTRSVGCRDEWVAALKRACQRLGEPPPGAAEHAGLFTLRLDDGRRMIVGSFPQGCDDQGRPGALAFHGLFVGPWSYRWAGANPFGFVPALRPAWTAEDQSRPLPAGRLAIAPPRMEPDEEARRIAGALSRRRKIVVYASRPIDDLARRVWPALPGRVHRRASVATWAFRNENGFDLIGVPRGLGLRLDGSELVLGRDPGEGTA